MRLGIGEHQWDEEPMIVAAIGIVFDLPARPAKERARPRRKLRRTRSRPAELIRLGREAIIIKIKRRLLPRHHAELRRLPMRGDDEHRFWLCLREGAKLPKIGRKLLNLASRQAELNEGPRATTVRDIGEGHAAHAYILNARYRSGNGS